MIFSEHIDIESQDPPALTFLPLLKEGGFEFHGVFPDLVRLVLDHHTYDASTFERVRQFLLERNLPGSVRRAIIPEYDPEDERRAELRTLEAPDIWVPGFPSVNVTCNACGRATERIDSTCRVKRVDSCMHIGYVNGEFAIVSAAAV
jgi:hypothetical protein